MQTLLEERTLPFFSQLLPPLFSPSLFVQVQKPYVPIHTHTLQKPRTFQALFAQQSHFSKALKICI